MARRGEAGGEALFEISLASPSGARARVLSWGATLRDLEVPGPEGALRRVVLGYADIAAYRTNPYYLGATCGRVANRIGDGRFVLDGRPCALARNEGGRTHLHGGRAGFSHRPWRIAGGDASWVTLVRTSPDGEENYPGTLEVSCTYALPAPGTLSVTMRATSDAATPVNLAHHSYFTLDPGTSVRELEIEIAATHYTPVDAASIPTGELAPVEDTPFDLRSPRRLGADPTAYDINYVLDDHGMDRAVPRFAARARSRRSGMSMEVWTTEPGLQLYDGGHLRAGVLGLDGRLHGPNAGLCLEAQNFPDAVNRPGFPSPILRPGETYHQITEYRFATG